MSGLSFEDRHAAYMVGYDLGMSEGLRAEVEDQARAMLHQQALESLGMARQLARTKGPAWEAMIRESGETDE